MRYDLEIEIDAAPATVWRVLSDLERWPSWTSSVRSVEPLDGPVAVGTRVRVRQPKLPTVMWEVTAWEPGRSFTWRSRSVGADAIASHTIVDDGDGTSTVALSITQSGPIGALVGAVARRLTKRYVGLEAEGLKSASESAEARSRAAS